MSYFDHTVSAEGVEANDNKILKIKTWPVTCNVDEVRTILRRIGGPRKPSTSDRWKWTDAEQHFVLHTDACLSGFGAVLYQIVDGREHVIAYPSRSLNKAEKKYPAHKLEFLYRSAKSNADGLSRLPHQSDDYIYVADPVTKALCQSHYAVTMDGGYVVIQLVQPSPELC